MPNPLPIVRVSADRQRLETADGRPFFWLADTAWQLTHALDRAEIDLYLQTRARQRFNVVQAVALAEVAGLSTPNANGDFALHDADPSRPNDAYFQHIDWTIQRAAELGIYVALLPTWGDKFNPAWAKADPIFNPDNARAYGHWIGRRYKDSPSVIWVMGGDRALQTDEHRHVVRAMAEGIRSADPTGRLMTFHPPGHSSSSRWVQDEPWLDMNMLQSGHGGRDVPNWEMISSGLDRTPRRPVLDGEPCYEDHPVMRPMWRQHDGWFDQYDVRKAAWRSLFAGACGHTYGCHDVWQMYDPIKRPPGINRVRTPWQAAIHLPGANQMQHVCALAESRPQYVGKRWESIYYPITTDACFFRERPHRVTLLDPRTGEQNEIGVSEAGKEVSVPLPGDGPDWVLVLDEVG